MCVARDHPNMRTVSVPLLPPGRSRPAIMRSIQLFCLVATMVLVWALVGYASKVWFEDSSDCTQQSAITLYCEAVVTTYLMCASYHSGWHHRLRTRIMDLGKSLLALVYAWSVVMVLGECQVYKCSVGPRLFVAIWTAITTIVILATACHAGALILSWGDERVARFSTSVDVRQQSPCPSILSEESLSVCSADSSAGTA